MCRLCINTVTVKLINCLESFVYVCVTRIYHAVSQAVEAVVHCQHLVALEEPDPDS